jgi:hypothetical protein
MAGAGRGRRKRPDPDDEGGSLCSINSLSIVYSLVIAALAVV